MAISKKHMNQTQQTAKIERTSNALFESGKVVSRSVVFILVITSALVLVVWGVNPDRPIAVPIAGLSLDRFYAIGVFLVVYTLSLLQFVVQVNYQKYLFWELSDLIGSKGLYDRPWQCLYPGTINYFIFYKFIHRGKTQKTNSVIVVLTIMIIVYVPLPVMIELFKERKNDILLLSMVAGSALFYLAALKNIKSHLRLISERNIPAK
jgi:hypothetical protein